MWRRELGDGCVYEKEEKVPLAGDAEFAVEAFVESWSDGGGAWFDVDFDSVVVGPSESSLQRRWLGHQWMSQLDQCENYKS